MNSLENCSTSKSFLEAEWVITIQTPNGGIETLTTALARHLPLVQGHYSHCSYLRHGGRCRFKSEAGAQGGAEDVVREVDSLEVVVSIPQDPDLLGKAIEIIYENHVHEEPTVRVTSEYGLRSRYKTDFGNPNKYWNRPDRHVLHGSAVPQSDDVPNNQMTLTPQGAFSDPTYQCLDWHREVVVNLEHRLSRDSGFPCTFSKNAFARELAQFVFVEDSTDTSIRHLARALSDYIALSNSWDGSLNSACPLIVAFSEHAIKSEFIEQYHEFGWAILQRLHELDTHPWPKGVSEDPNSPFWSMCFNGMQIFVNMSCPAYSARRSRNLGDHLLFIVNPRARFDVVAGDNPAGRKVRQTIRNRIEAYDGQPHSPQLGSYLAGEIEWWQYGILDENREREDRCPFVFKERKAVSE